MELANKFFMFSDLSNDVLCDFRRLDDKIMFTFCHVADKEKSDRLTVTVRNETLIDNVTSRSSVVSFVSYELENINHVIKQAESHPIYNRDDVLSVVRGIVNDVFYVDTEE